MHLSSKNQHLLVVDDEPDNFEVIDMLLFQEGYQLHYVSGGAEALAFLEQMLPDVILLDVMMPEMDGREVCRRFKTHPDWKHVPVIMVTAMDSKEDLALCLDAGADDFASKPVNGLELRSRVRSMLRIKRQYDELKEMMQLREDLSDAIVHDLRTPLTGLIFSCELLRKTELSERQEKNVERIAQCSQRMQSMIDSLLVMAKLRAGKMELHCEPIDLAALVITVAEDFEAIAHQKGIQIALHLPEAQKTINLDAILFRRVLDNLLSNAVKFSPTNTTITLRVEYPPGAIARVSVLDEGKGMSEATRQRVFQKYEIGETMQGVSQTGIGLAFCKLVVDAHGGAIAADTNLPQGTAITIAL